MPDTTTAASFVLTYDDEAERVLAALAGEPGHDCMYCGRVLSGEHDGWAHKKCEEVTEAEREAREIHTNDPPAKVERRLRKQGRCPHQTRAPGWDGGGIYCGREITSTGGDDPDLFCLEHQCEYYGDEEGAVQERTERTLSLLGIAT